MEEVFSGSELIETADKRQYHIGLAPGELNPYIVLCGDTDRLEKVAQFLEEKGEVRTNREYRSVSGIYKGIPISILTTGIGCDNTEIAVVEITQIVKNPTMIRVGSCGGIKKDVVNGDIVISSGALRLETTSTYYVSEGYPSIADHEVSLALLQAAEKMERKYHFGITGTACGFYGAEGRRVPGFNLRYPNIQEDLERMNVLNLEMEASTLFTLSSLSGSRSGTVCAVYADRNSNSFVTPKEKEHSEKDCIKIALEAFVVLDKMDRKKGKNRYWLPDMGI